MEENPLLLQRQSHFAPQNKEDLIMGIIRAITQAIGGGLADQWLDRKSTRLNSSHDRQSRMPSSA